MFRQMRGRLDDMKTIKRLLSHAEEIAHREGIAQPAAEHLILAALELPDGTARAAFERIGVSPDRFSSAVEEQHAEGLESIGVVADHDRIRDGVPVPPPAGGVYRSEPSAQELFRLAGADARAQGGGLLGAHVVRAATTMEHGTVARTLLHMGIDRAALGDAATAEITMYRNA